MYTIRKRAVRDLGTPAVTSLTSAADSSFKLGVSSEMDVMRLMVTVTTATVSTGNIVVTFNRCPTWDSGGAGARVSLGTITIPTAATVGQVYYKDINPTQVNPGELIVVAVSTAAAGGSAAGAGFWDVELSDSPEAAKNQANMVASA